jgi:hypothetical protein
MISLEDAQRTDRLMRATTSLTVAEFEALAGRLESVWAAQCARQTLGGQERQRQPGGGRKSALATVEQKLFFILFYYKAYPIQDVMGLLFDLTQSSVSEWVGRLTAVVGQLVQLHKPARRGRDLQQLLADDPELREGIIDGTQRRLPRPQHAGRQRRYYSGRKKRHALKNVIVVAKRKVLWCSPTMPARRHDKAVTETARLRLPKKIMVLGDSGFAGLEVGDAPVVTPWKRRRGQKKLSKKRRAFNRLLARHRIPVEHVLASIKRLRILRDEFRNRRRGLADAVMEIGCALHNFRCDCRPQALAA